MDQNHLTISEKIVPLVTHWHRDASILLLNETVQSVSKFSYSE